MKTVMRIVLALIVALMVSTLPAYADHGHGHVHFGVGVVVGPGWWGPYPYYPYYPETPVIEEQPPYVQQAPEAEQPHYWYFCQDPQGYYPYVKNCPKGWQRVVPPNNPPGGEE